MIYDPCVAVCPQPNTPFKGSALSSTDAVAQSSTDIHDFLARTNIYTTPAFGWQCASVSRRLMLCLFRDGPRNGPEVCRLGAVPQCGCLSVVRRF